MRFAEMMNHRFSGNAAEHIDVARVSNQRVLQVDLETL